MTFVAPCPGPLPNKLLLAGSLAWVDWLPEQLLTSRRNSKSNQSSCKQVSCIWNLYSGDITVTRFLGSLPSQQSFAVFCFISRTAAAAHIFRCVCFAAALVFRFASYWGIWWPFPSSSLQSLNQIQYVHCIYYHVFMRRKQISKQAIVYIKQATGWKNYGKSGGKKKRRQKPTTCLSNLS